MTTQETITLYKFEELSQEAKERAIEKYREHCLDYDWWEFEFEDFNEQLKEVGLSCRTFYFDIYRNEFTMGGPSIDDIKKFMISAGLTNWLIANELAGKEEINFSLSIMDSNKNNAVYFDDIYREAGEYQGLALIEDKSITEEERKEFDDMEEKLSDFLFNLRKKFLKQLREQEDYLTSDEAIKDTLIANEYDFEVDGRRW